MKIPLTEAQIIYLEEQHKAEHDGLIRDRIKAVLLNDKGGPTNKLPRLY